MEDKRSEIEKKSAPIMEKFMKQLNFKESQRLEHARLKRDLESATKNRERYPKDKNAVRDYHHRYDLLMKFETETGLVQLAKAFCKEQAKKYRFNIKIN